MLRRLKMPVLNTLNVVRQMLIINKLQVKKMDLVGNEELKHENQGQKV